MNALYLAEIYFFFHKYEYDSCFYNVNNIH